MLESNKLITNFKLKPNFLMNFLNRQCTTAGNPSSVPENISFETAKRLSTFEISNDHIIELIRSLDPSKVHSHDGISIRMLKLCGTSISKPLQILYKNCLDNECFPQMWKKANIVSIHKKGDKQQKHYCLFLIKFLKK